MLQLPILRTKQRAPASCVIRVGREEREASETYPLILSLEAAISRREAGSCKLVFDLRRDETGRVSIADDGTFVPWTPITILAHFGAYEEEILRGVVREAKPSFPENPGEARLEVEIQDLSFPMDREHVRKVWGAEAPKTDRAILQEIATKYRLRLSGDSADGQQSRALNQDKTDIKFARERAEANGFELIFRGDEIYFGPFRLDHEPQEAILVYAGRDTNCISFELVEDSHEPDAVAFDQAAAEGDAVESEVVAPDLPLLGREPPGAGDSGFPDFVWRMSREGDQPREAQRARAQALANERSMKIKANGQLDGSLYGHVLRIAEPVLVDGIGERYGGLFYVDNVRHAFDATGYRQNFELLRNAVGEGLTPASAIPSRLAALL